MLLWVADSHVGGLVAAGEWASLGRDRTGAGVRAA
jgi:hypothetical protein